MAKKE